MSLVVPRTLAFVLRLKETESDASLGVINASTLFAIFTCKVLLPDSELRGQSSPEGKAFALLFVGFDLIHNRTAGMSNSATVSKRDVYDPAKKVGLRPKETVPGTGATYVVSGHVVRGSSDNPASSLFISENMGREGQAKAARKMAAADSEKTLKSLLGRDKEGMKAVMRAREAGKMLEEGKEIKFVKRGRGEMEMESEEGSGGTRSYAASVIKELGFDPVAMKVGSQRNKTADVQKKVSLI